MVSGKKEDSFVFRGDAESLQICIEEYIANVDLHYREIGVANFTAGIVARRLSGNTKTEKDLFKEVNSILYRLKHNKVSHPFKKSSIFSLNLGIILKRAVAICANDSSIVTAGNDEVSEVTNNQEDYKNSEKFIDDQNEQSLSKCIEDYVSNTDPYYVEQGIAKKIAELSASRFGKDSKAKSNFNMRVNDFFHDLQRKKSHIYNVNETLLIQLRTVMKKALEECIESKISEVPPFKGEPSEITDILNYILIIWPFKLNNMILTQSGRATLRRYAQMAQPVLRRALNNYNNFDDFRLALRIYWYNRARFYYDRGSESHYIPHRFTLNNPRPHMREDLDTYSMRCATDFNIRNPPEPRWNLYNILSIHSWDRLGEGEFDIFSIYENQGLSSAEYYFENQINLFYRILFFFIELEAWDILTDESPYDSIPEEILAILYDDEAYRNYLIRERIYYELVESDVENDIRLNLAKTARVYEENLWKLRTNTPSTSGVQFSTATPSTTILTSSTTTISASSTTPQSRKRSNKGSVCVNQNGKHFDKRPRTSSSDGSCYSDYDISKAENFKTCTDLCLWDFYIYFVKNTNGKDIIDCPKFHTLQSQQTVADDDHYFGFITQVGDPNNIEELEDMGSGWAELLPLQLSI